MKTTVPSNSTEWFDLMRRVAEQGINLGPIGRTSVPVVHSDDKIAFPVKIRRPVSNWKPWIAHTAKDD